MHEILADIVAGACSSLAIAPVMSIIDHSIIKAQFEKLKLKKSVTSVANNFVNGTMKWNPSLKIMNNVYTATYVTANVVETICHKNNIEAALPTTFFTTLVNIIAISYKDKEYAKLNGQTNIKFPKLSYGLFGIRDGITITSSFVIKPHVRTYLEKEWKLSHNNADLAASFAVPMIAQIFSTPIHIYSLDIYHRPQDTLAHRLALIRNSYTSVFFGRILRIIPAFGICGFLNDVIKENMDSLLLGNKRMWT